MLLLFYSSVLVFFSIPCALNKRWWFHPDYIFRVFRRARVTNSSRVKDSLQHARPHIQFEIAHGPSCTNTDNSVIHNLVWFNNWVDLHPSSTQSFCVKYEQQESTFWWCVSRKTLKIQRPINTSSWDTWASRNLYHLSSKRRNYAH